MKILGTKNRSRKNESGEKGHIEERRMSRIRIVWRAANEKPEAFGAMTKACENVNAIMA
jgi:hypothetical protein